MRKRLRRTRTAGPPGSHMDQLGVHDCAERVRLVHLVAVSRATSPPRPIAARAPTTTPVENAGEDDKLFGDTIRNGLLYNKQLLTQYCVEGFSGAVILPNNT
eukprot:5967833-Pyramimonas_sp.AAC.2